MSSLGLSLGRGKAAVETSQSHFLQNLTSVLAVLESPHFSHPPWYSALVVQELVLGLLWCGKGTVAAVVETSHAAGPKQGHEGIYI